MKIYHIHVLFSIRISLLCVTIVLECEVVVAALYISCKATIQ